MKKIILVLFLMAALMCGAGQALAQDADYIASGKVDAQGFRGVPWGADLKGNSNFYPYPVPDVTLESANTKAAEFGQTVKCDKFYFKVTDDENTDNRVYFGSEAADRPTQLDKKHGVLI